MDDRDLNYRSIFSSLIDKATIRGDNLTGCCPIHKDSNPSFSVDLNTGKCKCFSCGWEGNYITLYAALHGLSNADAISAIERENGLQSASKGRIKAVSTYTVADYCNEKRFETSWLKEWTGMAQEGKDKDGSPWVRIPYYYRDGKEALFRKRYHKSSTQRFKWGHGSAGKLLMYGEWHLDDAERDGYAVLVEGESDTQTLWLLDIRALGVPGASTFKPDWCEKLKAVPKLYLHIEPDQGGKVFLEQMLRKLKAGGYEGEVYQWSCSQFGVKDPSDLYVRDGKEVAAEKVKAALKDAKHIDLNRLEDEIPAAIKDAPRHLRNPAGWIHDEKGIHRVDEQTSVPTLVCRTPIIIYQRILSQDTLEEKIEVAFKRDGKWHKSIFPRSTIFTSRGIVELGNLGATVTSENAKLVVSFLSALESENFDIIPTITSATAMGWQSKGRFLPWYADDMVLDVAPTMQRWAGACVKQGDMAEWIVAMAQHRQRHSFRFMLASAFAPPLLRIVKGRSFVVYTWCNSRSGKTAALKAALSVWGDPDKLMVTFNATRVALERMASFFCDVPLGIDERQLAGNSKQEGLEALVYMMANGISRGRGSKEGGIQAINTWRTVALMTGEEPITRSTSMTGVATRTIEVTEPPFERETDAAEMHRLASLHTGWAGEAFVGDVMRLGDDKVSEMYGKVSVEIEKITAGRNASKVGNFAVVALADIISSQLLFGYTEEDAFSEAMDMINHIEGDMDADEVPDVNISAVRFISDWIEMHRERNFTFSGPGPLYGIIEDDDAYILQTPLMEALEGAGYSYRKTMRFLKEEGVVSGSTDGKNRLAVTKRFGGKVIRAIKMSQPALRMMLGTGQVDTIELTEHDEPAQIPFLNREKYQ